MGQERGRRGGGVGDHDVVRRVEQRQRPALAAGPLDERRQRVGAEQRGQRRVLGARDVGPRDAIERAAQLDALTRSATLRSACGYCCSSAR